MALRAPHSLRCQCGHVGLVGANTAERDRGILTQVPRRRGVGRRTMAMPAVRLRGDAEQINRSVNMFRGIDDLCRIVDRCAVAPIAVRIIRVCSPVCRRLRKRFQHIVCAGRRSMTRSARCARSGSAVPNYIVHRISVRKIAVTIRSAAGQRCRVIRRARRYRGRPSRKHAVERYFRRKG